MGSRKTSTYSVLVPITTPIRLLPENFSRLLYSIQNLDGANFIAVSSRPNVTAAAGLASDGQEIVAGGYVSDDTDQAEVWAVADTAACRVTVQEVSWHEAGKPRSEPIMPSGTHHSPATRRPTREAARRRARLASRFHG